MTGFLTKPLILPSGGKLKNRIAKAAMTEGLADAWNRATQRHQTLYRRWAEGGAGLLITGNVMVDRRYLERPGNVAIDGTQTDEQLDLLKRWSGAAREADADIWMQISHAGRQTPNIVAKEPVAPSAVALGLPSGQFGTPRALTGDEIEEVIARFANAASVAKRAGFSGVQIHAAHGYLISEFLNPRANLREDDWGGALENRARLLMRVIKEVRAQVGSGFPLSVKLNSSDFQKGGFSPAECLQVASWLNEAGVDLLEVSGGSYEQPAMMDLEGMEARYEETKREATREREAYFLTYAEEIRAVAKVPLMVTGGFRSRAGMEEALSSGACDVIGLARPLCVDPNLPEKLFNGEIDVAPSYEKLMRLGPGVFGPNSGVDFLKALNGFSVMAFFYENIYRLSEGRETAEKMALLPAFLKYQMGEARKAKALER
ncbi:NADH:flavin oxidoreductase/NADH oxidase family protein [Hyphococcus luteus]|uniref:NADH:flavin oxidoreductase n=1 Tax=Hyphococcus luteus TaxID=2058213 RepID=A0A2S7K982_9PROT|nr:NADH:flavin oxidoreductase/NADH oxidase family protein [Marinicaulis flavus]PQA89066.1 NADH:flavin oxidoreductase [Marinicaulis flavus]